MAALAPAIIYIVKAEIKGKQRRCIFPEPSVEFCSCLIGRKYVTWPPLALERLRTWLSCLKFCMLLAQAKLGSASKATNSACHSVGHRLLPSSPLPDKQWSLALLHFLFFLHQSTVELWATRVWTVQVHLDTDFFFPVDPHNSNPHYSMVNWWSGIHV